MATQADVARTAPVKLHSASSATIDGTTSTGAMDRFGSLNIFVRAAETRSFTEAGRQIGISASAVGKAISRLETRLGARLFHRSTRSITLTPEGALFLTRCQRIFEEIEAAESELALAHAAPRGKLRVSMPMVTKLMMPVIGEFMKAYPEIMLDIDFSDRMVDVIEEGFDVVMRTGDVNDSQLITRTMGTYVHLIVASPAYLAKHPPLTMPEALVHHACLQHRFPTTGKLRRWPLERDGESIDIDLPTTAIATAVEPLIAMAEQDLGLACVPDFTVRAQVESGTLVPVLREYSGALSVFRALWPSGGQLTPKMRAFVDFMSVHLFPVNASAPQRSPGD
ncbi:LysR family transcriptional regulator [Paraburkholderia caribensis]|jgi:DNA-binding transcriptional LysR family regulator|uniref:LysR family transcriptional regulator n=1 Tax=Paraburkholderia caribensis TaxID=75105 RepID=UPI00071F5313|nr:LysR family transcriptional regulator [Paraburkholderia caribensis]ALP64770.1 LysR family transcriptional regulator [Paraburkholderia caribensis]AUT54082.1 LysR family transcriptional regulator [Paraburkholderia caribensis]CAG9214171.1 LysR family transcriptional regulator [Paraburkholderia caribensis]